MSERLGNISRALNIGMQTIANFLESNGHYVELNPNVKITDEQYDMLIQHFGMGTRLSAFPWKEDHFNSDANLNRKTVNSHGWNKLRDDIVLIMPTRLILVPKDQSVDQFSYWTVSDFKEKCHSAMDGGKIIKELLSIPSGYIPVTPNIAEPEQEQKNNLSSEKKIEIFTPRHQTSVKVFGTDDNLYRYVTAEYADKANPTAMTKMNQYIDEKKKISAEYTFKYDKVGNMVRRTAPTEST